MFRLFRGEGSRSSASPFSVCPSCGGCNRIVCESQRRPISYNAAMSREFWQTLRRSLIKFPGEPVYTRMAAVGKGILTAFLLCLLLGVLVAVLVPEVSVSAKNVAGRSVWLLSIGVGIWTAK